MPQDDRKSRIGYQPMVDERRGQTSHGCYIRPDDSGLWNKFKAWHLFLLHLATCVAFLVCLEEVVDGQDFQIGSAPSPFTLPLYQAQVTGLMSLSLVLIRTLAGACSTLITWRIISVLLNGEGATLVELVRLLYYRMPVFPRGRLGPGLFWSIWAMLVVIFTWPSAYVSPLATSSVSWIPGTILSSNPLEIQTQIVDGSNNWNSLIYPGLSLRLMISAASMVSTDPAYAFDPKESSLRRYFSSEQDIPPNSSMNITMPYLDVGLHWINGADETRFQNVGHPEKYANILDCSDVNFRADGLVSILRNTTWDKDKAKPRAAEVFFGRKFVSVKVTTLDIKIPLPDGTTVRQDTPCPTTSLSLGKLPNVTQKEVQYYETDTNKWLGKDCFLVAEVSFTAGKYSGKNCIVRPAGSNIYSATCAMQTSADAAEADWVSRLSIDFMSEIMRNIVMLKTTYSWMDNNIEGYTTGMLHLAYHATWSSFAIYEGKYMDTATVRPAKSIIRARVEHSKMLIWFCLCSTMPLSAVLLFLGLIFTSTKTIRDPVLAALSMDLSEVAHSGHADGLCNTVALSKEDKKLPKLRFANDHDEEKSDQCRRRLVFADSPSHPERG